MHHISNGESALEKLLAGNRRFASGVRSVESLMSSLKLKELATKGQSPFAIVIACSDSRVPAEIVFDCGLGELFVVRMAGNVITDEVVASVEFAASNFNSPLCVVMGHTSCGAVNAAIDANRKHLSAPSPFIDKLLGHIESPVCHCKKQFGFDHPHFTELVIEQNALHSAQQLVEQSQILRRLVIDRQFQVVSGVYNLQSGRVEIKDSPIGLTVAPQPKGLNLMPLPAS